MLQTIVAIEPAINMISSPIHKAKKYVRFSTSVSIHRIKIVPAALHPSVWYKTRELSHLHDRDMKKTMQLQAQGAMMGHAPSNDIYTLRGLEHYQGLQSIMNGDKRKNYIAAVLRYAHWLKTSQGYIDVDKLQLFAITKSRRELRKAQAIGMQDAMEVYHGCPRGTQTSDIPDHSTSKMIGALPARGFFPLSLKVALQTSKYS